MIWTKDLREGGQRGLPFTYPFKCEIADGADALPDGERAERLRTGGGTHQLPERFGDRPDLIHRDSTPVALTGTPGASRSLPGTSPLEFILPYSR